MVVLERRGIPSDHPVACISEDYDVSPLSCGRTLSEQGAQICEQNSADMNDVERQLRKHQKLQCAWSLGADPGSL